MKRISILAIAALAALAMTAAVGSASASASNTVLCYTNANPCPSGQIAPAGTFQRFAGTLTVQSTTSGAKYECNQYGILMQSTAEKEFLLPGEDYYWGAAALCSSSSVFGYSNCTASASTEGAVYGWGGIGRWDIGQMTVNFKCAEMVNTCTFVTDGDIGMTLQERGVKATISNRPATKSSSSAGCPGGTTFTISFANGWQENGGSNVYLTKDA